MLFNDISINYQKNIYGGRTSLMGENCGIIKCYFKYFITRSWFHNKMPNSFTYLIWHQDSKFLEIRKIIGCAGKTQKELKKKKNHWFLSTISLSPSPPFHGALPSTCTCACSLSLLKKKRKKKKNRVPLSFVFSCVSDLFVANDKNFIGTIPQSSS